MGDTLTDRLGAGRILITGPRGQLGTALGEVFPAADRTWYDVTEALPVRPELVLHAAAWTDVDAAEAEPEAAERINVLGTRNVVALGAPVVYFSTDYVFDGAKSKPYVESDEPNPLSVYGRTKLLGEAEVERGWIIRSSWLFGWTGRNFLRTMLALARDRREVRVVSDQWGAPTYVGHLAAAVRTVLELPYGTYHVAASGECSWAEFAEAIFAEAGVRCRVVPITSAELGRPAPRPSCSVLSSEYARAPRLPDWRSGLRACLERLQGSPPSRLGCQQ
jgi:dTDP-4-dehydrorhamnose reductase